jgi:hypothetical protein
MKCISDHYNKNKERTCVYRIIDTDFTDTNCDAERTEGQHFCITRIAAVINTYEKLNLPVAANLVLAIKHISEYNIPTNNIIDMNKKYNPKFDKYENDLQKYLCLL